MNSRHQSAKRVFLSLGLVLAIGMGGGAVMTTSPAFACGTAQTTFTGTICTFAFNYCPHDYLPADGTLASMRERGDLYSLLGTAYGGDGVTTFGLPDLRGRASIGAGQVPMLNESIRQGEVLGNYTITMTTAQMPIHSHAAEFTPYKEQQTVSVDASGGDLAVAGSLAAKTIMGAASAQDGSYLGQGGAGTSLAPIYVAPGSTAAEVHLAGLDVHLTGTPGHQAFAFDVEVLTGGAVTVDAAGGWQPIDVMSPAQANTVCIMANGLFPSR